MKSFYNSLGTLVFKCTTYLILLSLTLSVIIALKNENYDVVFQTLLISAATVIAISQSFFSYAETTNDLRELSLFSGRKLIKVAIWLGATSMILIFYVLFKLNVEINDNLKDAVNYLLLGFAFLNLTFATTNLHAALNSIQKILFRREDSEL
jgi:hypothetical protein